MTKYGIIDGFQLKLMMCVLMLLDHIYYFLPGQPQWFTLVGRVVAPVFVFLMTEGMTYTRNRGAYIRRMLLFGGGMLALQIFVQLLLGDAPDNSIFLSLGLTAGIIYCIDKYRASYDWWWTLSAIGLLFLSLFFEGAFFCPLLGIIFYYLRSKPVAMSVAYIASSVLLAFVFQSPAQHCMVMALIPIFLYNGRRGLYNNFSKYFFYIFYPAHIYILFSLARYLARG